MKFSKALKLMRQGKSIARHAWGDDTGLFLKIEKFQSIFVEKPCIYFCTTKGIKDQWQPAQCDILADDWFVPETIHVTFKNTDTAVDVCKVVQDYLNQSYQKALDTLDLDEGDNNDDE